MAIAQLSPMKQQGTASPKRRRVAARGALSSVATVLSGLLALLVWDLVVRLGRYPEFILPGPGSVFSRMRELLADGTLQSNALVTIEEAGIGFGIALAIALPLGYCLAHAPIVERFFAPVIAASQAVPAIALAPLLYLWLSNGLWPKIAVSTVVVIFPLLVNSITGIRGVGKEYLEVARVFGAPWWEQVLRVELPLAAPVLLGGAKLGLTLSMTGAVVGEFLGADQGLGFLLNYYRDNQDTPALFAILFTLGVIGVSLYSFVSFLERIASRWQG